MQRRHGASAQGCSELAEQDVRNRRTADSHAIAIRAGSAAAAGAIIGIIGLLAVWTGYPFLIASLGPTAALQATCPDLPMSRPWNVVAGHLAAVAAAVLAVHATGAIHTSPFAEFQPLSLLRVAAAALALALTIGLELLFDASHAPGAATALLIALGLIAPSWSGIGAVLCGIAAIALLGEALRRLRLTL